MRRWRRRACRRGATCTPGRSQPSSRWADLAADLTFNDVAFGRPNKPRLIAVPTLACSLQHARGDPAAIAAGLRRQQDAEAGRHTRQLMLQTR